VSSELEPLETLLHPDLDAQIALAGLGVRRRLRRVVMPVATLLAIRGEVVRRRLGADLLLEAVKASDDLVFAAHGPILAVTRGDLRYPAPIAG
jgi:hypothetical protein